ncbi:MAG: hypothetical protein JJU29_02485 [Verrucomicrobia bacterium]|nr:hypothetical protein [Verrucomicrobiota bacterium]MCH8511204.1 hypothetical protein [Kiritimatiellia bacterium]
MPYTVNGFGTGYAGKKNRHQSLTTCEFCGYEGLLDTYDTLLCLTALFVPLIPLRRKRVINDCPKCRRHRVLSLKEWQKTVREVVGEVTASPEGKSEADAVTDLLGALVGLQAYQEFRQVAEALENRQWQSMTPLVVLSEAWEHFLDRQRAEEIMHRVVQSDPSPDNERRLFVLAALNGNFDYILPRLRDELQLEEPDPLKISAALQAMIAYGRAEEALDYIPQARTVAGKREFQEELAYLEQTAKRPKGKDAKTLRRFFILKPVIKSEATLGFRVASWALPVLAVVVMGIMIMLSLANKNDVEFTLVNGLPVAYEVVVNGEAHFLGPNRRREISLPEGKIRLEIRNRDEDLIPPPPETLTFRRGFFERISDSRKYVINPDRQAVLLWESAEYRTEANLNRAREPRYALHSGELLTSFDTDYFMQALPNQLRLTGNSHTWKSTVTVLPFNGMAEHFQMLYMGESESAAKEWLLRAFALQPDRHEILEILSSILPPEESVENLQPFLRRHPPKIEVHRYYQSVMERMSREDDLEPFYGEMLSAHPDDAVWMYLLARATLDPDLAHQRFFRLSERSDAPPHTHNAIAYHHAVRGEFAMAKPHVQVARELDPDHKLFESMWLQVLWATEDWDPLVAHLNRLHEDAVWNFEHVRNYGLALILSGQPQRADRLRDGYHALLYGPESTVFKEDADELIRQLRFHFDYAAATFDPMAYPSGNPGKGHAAFMLAASKGDLDACHAYLTELDEPSPFEQRVVMAVLSLRQDRADLADEYLGHLEEMLSGTSREIRTFLQWLKADEAPSAEDVTAIAIQPEVKKYLVAILAGVFPESAPAYAELQSKLNYKQVFPSRILDLNP